MHRVIYAPYPFETSQESSTLRYIGEIHNALVTIDDTLNSLLNINKLEARVIIPEITDFRVGGLLNKIGSGFCQLARKKGLDLRVAPSSATIRSDEGLLRLRTAIGKVYTFRVQECPFSARIFSRSASL